MLLENVWPYIQDGGFYLWLAGALFFIIRLGVFSPKSLVAAPARQSSLSLPVVGAVIVLYFMMQALTLSGGFGLGWITPVDVYGASRDVASQPTATTRAATTLATVPATAAGTASAPAPPASTQAAAPPAVSVRTTVAVSAIDGIAKLLSVVLVVVFLPRFFKDRAAGWGLHPRQFPAGAFKGVFGFLLTFPVLIVFADALMRMYALFNHEMSEHTFFEAMKQQITLAQSTVLCVSAVVVAPIAEELFFRGIVQTTLIQYSWGMVIPQLVRPSAAFFSMPQEYRPSPLHRWGAILLTSAFFAWQHQHDQAPIIFVLSIGLGYVYERTGNLWAPMALHLAFNSTEIATFFAVPQ